MARREKYENQKGDSSKQAQDARFSNQTKGNNGARQQSAKSDENRSQNRESKGRETPKWNQNDSKKQYVSGNEKRDTTQPKGNDRQFLSGKNLGKDVSQQSSTKSSYRQSGKN